jgi:hypothetical protein
MRRLRETEEQNRKWQRKDQRKQEQRQIRLGGKERTRKKRKSRSNLALRKTEKQI